MESKLDHDYLRYYTPKQNDIWIDLGANYGLFIQEYIEIIKQFNIHVYCIEPNPEIIPWLQQWIDANLPNNITLMNIGIWTDNTSLPFLVVGDSASCAFETHIQPTVALSQIVKKINVEVITLDALITKIGKPIAFLKADVEGAELYIFNDCKQIHKIENMAIAAYHVFDKNAFLEVLPFLIGKELANITITKNNIAWFEYILTTLFSDHDGIKKLLYALTTNKIYEASCFINLLFEKYKLFPKIEALTQATRSSIVYTRRTVWQ